jgi:hypothetical protein
MKLASQHQPVLDDSVSCWFGNVDFAGRARSLSAPKGTKADGSASRPYHHQDRKESDSAYSRFAWIFFFDFPRRVTFGQVVA